MDSELVVMTFDMVVVEEWSDVVALKDVVVGKMVVEDTVMVVDNVVADDIVVDDTVDTAVAEDERSCSTVVETCWTLV